MRDDQVRRYARHIMLPDIGGLGQTALMVSAARVPLRENEGEDEGEDEPLAELTACAYLAAGGVGTLIIPSSSDTQRASIAGRGPDTKVLPDGTGRDVALAPRPAWWPKVDGDTVALAFWRGSIAAIGWMTDTVAR